MITSAEIKAYAAQLGADLCGIASIDRFYDAPEGFHPSDVLNDTQSVISFACRIPETPLLINTPSPYTALEDIVLARVNQIALSLTLYIEEKGYKAVLIPSVPYDYWDASSQTGKGILSLKHLGNKAGLGSIGKNSLLCNQEYGNLIKLGAVISNVALSPDEMMTGDLCAGSCHLCIKSCPVGAIGSDGSVSQLKCREYSEIKNKRGVEIYACNECRKVCPNRSGSRKLHIY